MSLDSFSNNNDVTNSPPKFLCIIKDLNQLNTIKNNYCKPGRRKTCPWQRSRLLSTYRGLNAMMTSNMVDEYCSYHDRECTKSKVTASSCLICGRNATANGLCRLCNFINDDDIFNRKNQHITYSTSLENRLIGTKMYLTDLKSHRDDLICKFLSTLVSKYKIHFALCHKDIANTFLLFTETRFDEFSNWTPIWQQFIKTVIEPAELGENLWAPTKSS